MQRGPRSLRPALSQWCSIRMEIANRQNLAPLVSAPLSLGCQESNLIVNCFGLSMPVGQHLAANVTALSLGCQDPQLLVLRLWDAAQQRRLVTLKWLSGTLPTILACDSLQFSVLCSLSLLPALAFSGLLQCFIASALRSLCAWLPSSYCWMCLGVAV